MIPHSFFFGFFGFLGISTFRRPARRQLFTIPTTDPTPTNTVNDCLVNDFGLPHTIFDPAPANLGLSGGRRQVWTWNFLSFYTRYPYRHCSPSPFFEYIIYCYHACHGGLCVGWLMLGETWEAHILEVSLALKLYRRPSYRFVWSNLLNLVLFAACCLPLIYSLYPPPLLLAGFQRTRT
ncbi:hypothetical protein F5144DRAFT_30883 [Chaetomium tenue]|uniref:Uncharacterized protein n=1 Tax=Chaetomium tenue TaxID=1854479 RepID=A0ACB7PRJ5_9PEZI|nr:hypothetical protein F5144DRAFT_30883 [Chaetomium globosum]